MLMMSISTQAFQAFVPCLIQQYPCHHSHQRHPSLVLSATAVTPIGPFCPFRSQASEQLNKPMKQVAFAAPQYETSLARLQLDLQMGNTPSQETLLQTSDMLETAVEQWEQLNQNMLQSTDFQSREYAHMTQAHLLTYTDSVEDLAASMKWQAACLRAMANNESPPLPPPGVNFNKLLQAAQDDTSPSIGTMMATAERLTAKPFRGDEAIFESSPLVKHEFEQLCRDHQHLVDFGGNYGNFDPLGKLYFLDEIQKIHERWDVFFARASLMEMIDSNYTRQVHDFLEAMDLNETTYRQQLDEAHQIMRRAAEKERNMI